MESKNVLRKALYQLGFDVHRVNHHAEAIAQRYPVVRPLNPEHVEILADPAFQASLKDIGSLSLLDTPRLANLWQICRQSNPTGAMMEVGTYKGGGALHLSNCFPERHIIICDSFEGFRDIDARLDTLFTKEMFRDTAADAVAGLFRDRKRRFTVIPGFFPESCEGRDLPPISFVHLDIDVYKPTLDALLFLDKTMMPESFIVLDDYLRSAEGIVQAVQEFQAQCPQWLLVPLFPGQGVLARRG